MVQLELDRTVMEPDPDKLHAGGRLTLRRGRANWRRRAGALALATLAQGGLLWLTTIQQRANPFSTVETSGLPVWIASPSVLMVRYRTPAPARHAPRAANATRSATALPSSAPRPAIAPSGPARQAPAGPAGAGVPAGVASALRNSLIGCANTAALGLSDAERAACRERLAAGAMAAPYRPGIPTEKRAYYENILAAEAAFRRNPMGGHGPVVFCYPGAPARPLPHALKIGPCYIEPPQGSLDVDVDVPEVGSQRDAQPPPR